MSRTSKSGGSKIGRSFGGLVILLLGLAAGGLLAFSPDIALPVAVLLLPGLIALAIDRSPDCGTARAMLLFQAAAAVHPVLDAWYHCAGIDGCMTYLAPWPAVLKVWLAAGVAWLLAQILPLALKALDDFRLQHRRTVLEIKRKALIEEWGLQQGSEE